MKMKKYIIILLISLFSVSCTDYLDKAPESGLSEEQVFSKLENIKLYFNGAFEARRGTSSGFTFYSIKNAYALNHNFVTTKFGLETLTDIADCCRSIDPQKWKRGEIMGAVNYIIYSEGNRPIFGSMFQVIRICNITLSKLDQVEDATPEEIEDLRGQAYFIRGFAHFALIRNWGPMPYITKAIEGNDAWDIPRLSIYESYQGVVKDMDLAYEAFVKAGKIRRDPGPGLPGHLNDPLQDRPGGVAAKALKSRALLYAASPLSNTKGNEEWNAAAAASWDAINTALTQGYELMPRTNYTDNFYGISKYCNEHLWAWNAGTFTYTHSDLQGLLNGIFANRVAYQAGECPTQNMVDLFETQWGDPLKTPEDRAKATELGHYNEQNPYVNRDPRLAINVIFNQADIKWPNVPAGHKPNKANMFYTMENGKPKYSDLLDKSYQGTSSTGYYVRKYFDDISKQNTKSIQMTDPLFRLTEMYLNYAEAANEAYGPNGTVPGANINAVQAINIIRNRIGMPDLESKYATDKETFRMRIKNERTVELCYEGFHRFYDIRRWKDAPEVMSKDLIGINVEKVPESAQYPSGFKYSRVALSSDRQPRWYDFMYYFPLHPNDYNKLVVFDTSLNPVWF